MKRFFLVWSLVLGTLVPVLDTALAGGIVNRQVLSSEYLRTFSRNGATDAADIACYNPAGTMEMDNGTRLNISGIYTPKEYANALTGVERYESDTASLGPALYVVHKEANWAVFGGFNIPGGGGKVDFDRGTATTFFLAEQIKALTPFDRTESMRLDADSFYYGYFAGGAFEVLPDLSLACGLKFVDATREADGTVTLSVSGTTVTPFKVKYDQTASGWSGILGLNYAPGDRVNLGLRYETSARLDFKTHIKKDDTHGAVPGVTEGAELTEDLPGLLGAGVVYRVLPDLLAEWSGTYFFEKAARWEGRLSGQGDSWETTLALEYDISPVFRASLGYMITRIGIDGDRILPEAPELDVKTLCGGFRYLPSKAWAVNLGLAKSIYSPEDTVQNGQRVSFDKMAPGVGLGVEYIF